jgi:hypothetical protein
METAIEDAGLDRGPTLTSSWDAACGALTQSLFLTRTGPRAQDLDFEQLLEPPAPRCAGPGPGSGDSHAAEEPGGGREPRRAREPSEAAGTAWGRAVVPGGGRGCGQRVRAGPERPGNSCSRCPPVTILLAPHPRTPPVFYLGGTRTTASWKKTHGCFNIQ